MRDQIIIRMPTDNNALFSWIKLSSSIVAPVVEQGSIDELVAVSTGIQVVVLVPGSDVILQNVSVPTQNKQRMLKAIRYANEDDLASDVDDLHFSLSKIEHKDHVHVAVVETELMDQWLRVFHDSGLAIDVMMPDLLAVPLSVSSKANTSESVLSGPGGHKEEQSANQLNIVIEDNAAILRGDDYDAFYVDLDNLKLVLSLWLHDKEDKLPESVVIWGNDSASQIPLEVPDGIHVEYRSVNKGLLGILASQSINFDKNINLLQGDYSRREQIGKIWRPWRLAASLAGVLFIFQLGLTIIQSSSLETQKLELKAELTKIYKDTFPEARRIVNPRRQMEQKIKELKGDNTVLSVTFLSLLADTSQIFKATSGLNLKSIRYKNSTLDVELEVPNYQVLDQLKQKLTKAGERSVEIQSAVTRNNIVQGRLQIKGLAS